jgi:hypothetical protein
MMNSKTGNSKIWLYILVGFVFGASLGFYFGVQKNPSQIKPIELQTKAMTIQEQNDSPDMANAEPELKQEQVKPTSEEKPTQTKPKNFFKNSQPTKASQQYFADKKTGEKKLPVLDRVKKNTNAEVTPVPEQPKIKYERDTAMFKDENKTLTIDEVGELHVRWYPVKGAVKYKLRVFDAYGKLYQEFETPLTYKFLRNLVSNNKGMADKTKFSYTMTVAGIDASGDESAPSPSRSIY